MKTSQLALVFSAGNHDRYKLCAIYSCHMSTKLELFLFSLQALCGSQVSVPLLGGERLALNLQDEVIKPSTVKRVVGKGLPNPKDPARRGDLIVNFDIVFPERLSTATRDLFRSHLPGK
jgi:DnaJ-class molecular chaperone